MRSLIFVLLVTISISGCASNTPAPPYPTYTPHPTWTPIPTPEIAIGKVEVPVEVTPVSSRISSTYVVVATNQGKCYDDKMEISCPQMGDSFHGQDAQYTRAEPWYVDKDDGTVTDLNTGLM